jgi:hypothetical protein
MDTNRFWTAALTITKLIFVILVLVACALSGLAAALITFASGYAALGAGWAILAGLGVGYVVGVTSFGGIGHGLMKRFFPVEYAMVLEDQRRREEARLSDALVERAMQIVAENPGQFPVEDASEDPGPADDSNLN